MRIRPQEAVRRGVMPLAGGLALRLPLAAQEAAQELPPTFWAEHGDKVVVAVVTAVLVLLVQKPVKALLEKVGRWLEHRLAGLGIRFTKRYLEALADQHRWLRLIGIYSRSDLHPPQLQEVYISLRLASAGVADGDRFSWSEALGTNNRRVAVLGAPGAGKTTLLDYLVLVLTGRVSHPLYESLDRPFPLFARLRDLGADEDRATLAGLLRASAPLGRLPGDFPERWLRRGGCVVLLDGLDEVLDEARHERALEEIQHLIADYPENRFAVTCRVAGWRNQLPDFHTYEIQELEDEDIRRFAGAWYREVLRTQKVNLLGAAPEDDKLQEAEREAYEEARRQADSLWDQLRSNPSLLLVARTPLILSLMLLLHHFRVAELPRGRAALYERCLEVLLEIWDAKEKRLALPQSLKLVDKLTVLRAIAYYFLEEDLLEADLAELQEIVGPLLPRLSSQELTDREILAHIHERSGLLVEQALGRYGFAHRALADYLAARHIVDDELDDRLIDRISEERWREVTLIAVGLAPPARAERLVEAFLSQGDESIPALEMAGLALGEEVHVEEDIRGRITHRLRKELDHLPEEQSVSFGRLAGALMTADLATAERWIHEVLRGRDQGLRKRVLGLLPELGEEHGRPLVSLLGSIIGAGGESVDLRSRATWALADLGVEPGLEIWRSIKNARASDDLGLRSAATWAWCRLGRHEELGFVEVPAGEFLMGNPKHGTLHPLFLPRFYIGNAPVTVGKFREFIETTEALPESPRSLQSPDDHPVRWVTWHEALACARWFGATLPSEAEWEKAARGTDGRWYPWDDEWRDGLANTAEYWADRRRRLVSWLPRRWTRALLLPPCGPARSGVPESSKSFDEVWEEAMRLERRSGGLETTPVGSFSPAGDSPYGCADMVGNVWEWTRSLCAWEIGPGRKERSFDYPYRPDDGREDVEAPDEIHRLLRGGSFDDNAVLASCPARLDLAPNDSSELFGFRWVSSPFSSDL